MKLKRIRHRYVLAAKKLPFLYDFSRSLSRFLGEKDPAFHFLSALDRSVTKVHFLQIGANDGMRNDPIREFVVRGDKWAGTLVEPIPTLFEQLKENYGYRNKDGRLEFRNLAISDNAHPLTLWFIRDKFTHLFPDYVNGMVSFNKEHFQNNFDFEVKEEHLDKIDVPCRSLPDLISEIPNHLDLVVIDTEGMEHSMIMAYPFENHAPGSLLYEVSHLTEQQKNDIEQLLRKHKYSLIYVGADAIAISESHLPGILQHTSTSLNLDPQ